MYWIRERWDWTYSHRIPLWLFIKSDLHADFSVHPPCLFELVLLWTELPHSSPRLICLSRLEKNRSKKSYQSGRWARADVSWWNKAIDTGSLSVWRKARLFPHYPVNDLLWAVVKVDVISSSFILRSVFCRIRTLTTRSLGQTTGLRHWWKRCVGSKRG